MTSYVGKRIKITQSFEGVVAIHHSADYLRRFASIVFEGHADTDEWALGVPGVTETIENLTPVVPRWMPEDIASVDFGDEKVWLRQRNESGRWICLTSPTGGWNAAPNDGGADEANYQLIVRDGRAVTRLPNGNVVAWEDM